MNDFKKTRIKKWVIDRSYIYGDYESFNLPQYIESLQRILSGVSEEIDPKDVKIIFEIGDFNDRGDEIRVTVKHEEMESIEEMNERILENEILIKRQKMDRIKSVASSLKNLDLHEDDYNEIVKLLLKKTKEE
jgi:hypothetical protein